jgi:hypothetical protein
MRSVHFICCLALLAGGFVCHPNDAGAQDADAARAACTPDAMRLCSEFIPDVAKVTGCMHAKSSELSPACRTAMAGGASRGSGGSDDGKRHARHYRRARHVQQAQAPSRVAIPRPVR